MAYTNQKLDYFKAGQTFRDLNPDKAKFANQASQYRCKAKKEKVPEKRKHFLKKAAEYQAKADACGPSVKASQVFPKMPKSMFKY